MAVDLWICGSVIDTNVVSKSRSHTSALGHSTRANLFDRDGAVYAFAYNFIYLFNCLNYRFIGGWTAIVDLFDLSLSSDHDSS